MTHTPAATPPISDSVRERAVSAARLIQTSAAIAGRHEREYIRGLYADDIILGYEAALLAARREERQWEARAKALWNHPRTMRPIPAGDDLYYLNSDPNFATTDPWALIDRALAATPGDTATQEGT